MALSILRRRQTKPINPVAATPSDHQFNLVLNLQQQKIGVEFGKRSQQLETMAHQSSRHTDREVQESFEKLYDKAAGLVESFRPCDCGTGANAEDDAQDLKTKVQDLLALRQRAGGRASGHPRDGTSVNKPSDKTLQTMLAKLEWNTSVLEEHLQLEPCVCGVGEPESVEETPVPVRIPPSLMSLPAEIRNMIWWRFLARETGFVRIEERRFFLRPHNVFDPTDNGRDIWIDRARFSVDSARTLPTMRWTFERDLEYSVKDADLRVREQVWPLPPLLRVSRQVYTEVEDEFWRRISADNLLLSFSHSLYASGVVYLGIIAAWTFFNNYRERGFQGIRRVHLNLARPDKGGDDSLRGNRGDALPDRGSGRLAMQSGRAYLEPLLDLMGTQLPNLQFLSLRIGGRVPDEPSAQGGGGSSAAGATPQDSVHWVTRMRRITGLTRLRLRVVSEPSEDVKRDSWNLPTDPEMLRTRRWVSMMRASMLINGDALGEGHIRAWVKYISVLGGPDLVIVQCNDSWNPETGEYEHHEQTEQDYDRGP